MGETSTPTTKQVYQAYLRGDASFGEVESAARDALSRFRAERDRRDQSSKA
ncbi:MAG: hypothetical protein M0R73_08605 [Dehalococcoidia bacterium]|nr:hypothetical protein [Dehalococcoidia bacterium]